MLVKGRDFRDFGVFPNDFWPVKVKQFDAYGVRCKVFYVHEFSASRLVLGCNDKDGFVE